VQPLKQQLFRGVTANTATLHKDNSFTLTSTVTVADFVTELQMRIADFPSEFDQQRESASNPARFTAHGAL
jgi:hypothetical protein